MMLFGNGTTANPSCDKFVSSKSWMSLGDGKEVLVKHGSEVKKSEEDKEIVQNAQQTAKIEAGDLIYYSDKWVKVEELKEKDKLLIKSEDKPSEILLSDCTKEIAVQILVCTPSAFSINLVEVNARMTLDELCKKMGKRCGVKAGKVDWYYQGKLKERTETIEGIKLKPGDKLACILLGFDMKTFKRFARLDDSRGWYMSRSSADGITFIPSKTINLFGFGMYQTKEGPPTYTLQYEVKINDTVAKQDSVQITKPSSDTQIQQVFLNPSKDPIIVSAGEKISVIVKYPDYEDASRLIVGTGGEGYDAVEGNEPGLFKLEECSGSGNGTDIGSGQIPELYYSLT